MKFLIQENTFENICKMSAICSGLNEPLIAIKANLLEEFEHFWMRYNKSILNAICTDKVNKFRDCL